MIVTLAALAIPGRASFSANVNPSVALPSLGGSGFEAVSDDWMGTGIYYAPPSSRTLSTGGTVLASDKNQVTPSSDSFIRQLRLGCTPGDIIIGIADPSISGVVSSALVQRSAPEPATWTNFPPQGLR